MKRILILLLLCVCALCGTDTRDYDNAIWEEHMVIEVRTTKKKGIYQHEINRYKIQIPVSYGSSDTVRIPKVSYLPVPADSYKMLNTDIEIPAERYLMWLNEIKLRNVKSGKVITSNY